MGLAGLWNEWTSPQGEKLMSFCMLTINASGHAVFQRMNRPGHEKRMPVILPISKQEVWLYGSQADAERLLVRFPADDLQAVPIEKSVRPLKEPPGWADVADMFEDEWRVTAAELPRKKPAKARPAVPPKPPRTAGSDHWRFVWLKENLMQLNLNDPRSIVAWWQVCPERHEGHLEALLGMRPQFGSAIRRAQRHIATNPELQALLVRSVQQRDAWVAQQAERDGNVPAHEARWRELAAAA